MLALYTGFATKERFDSFYKWVEPYAKTMIKPRFNVAEVKKTTSEGVALIILHCQTEIRLVGDKLRSEIQY